MIDSIASHHEDGDDDADEDDESDADYADDGGEYDAIAYWPR